MAQMKAVTVRAAQTNIAIGTFLSSVLAVITDRRRIHVEEALRCESLHTTMGFIIRSRVYERAKDGLRAKFP
jgi:hypothetical protein